MHTKTKPKFHANRKAPANTYVIHPLPNSTSESDVGAKSNIHTFVVILSLFNLSFLVTCICNNARITCCFVFLPFFFFFFKHCIPNAVAVSFSNLITCLCGQPLIAKSSGVQIRLKLVLECFQPCVEEEKRNRL